MSARLLIVLSLAASAVVIPLSASGAAADEITGRIVIEHGDDFVGGRQTRAVGLDAANGQRISLFGTATDRLQTGQLVSVSGWRRGDTLTVAGRAAIRTIDSSSTTARQLTAALADAAGDTLAASPESGAAGPVTKRLLVLMMNFVAPPPPPSPTPNPCVVASPSASPDPSASPCPPPPTPGPTPAPPRTPWTVAQITSQYFTGTRSLAAYYDEISHGQLIITGDVYGWFTLIEDTTVCDHNAWGSDARAAAATAGINVAAYTNISYVFPKVTACNWGGMANIAGPSSYINGNGDNLYVITHELGHNFGAHHAQSLTCTANGVRVQFSSSCTAAEYGDPFDTMGQSGTGGNSRSRLMNGYTRRVSDFLTTGDQLTVNVTGVYTVSTLELAAGYPRIVRVARPAGNFFYLDFRQPYGQFDNYATTDAAVNGIMIRLAPNKGHVQTKLIDAHPETATFSDAPLGVGQAFYDAPDQMVIQTLSIGASGAIVYVQFGAPPAVESFRASMAGDDARLSWSPAFGGANVAAFSITRNGTQVAYLPAGARTYSEPDLPALTTQAYGVVVVDAQGNRSVLSGASVSVPDVIAPTSIGLLAASALGEDSIGLSWQAAGDNVAVAGYQVRRDGALIASLDASTTGYLDTGLRAGSTHSYAVTALDAAGNASTATAASATTPDLTSPAMAADFQGTAGGGDISLSWAPASDNGTLAGYDLSRDGAALAQLDASMTSYIDTAVTAGQTYSYTLTARDAAGNRGAPASTDIALPLVDHTPPLVPAGLRGVASSGRTVTLSWLASTDNAAGAMRYRVFRDGRAIGRRQLATTFVDHPTVGVHYYQVRALDAAGNASAKSSPPLKVRARL